VGETYWNLEGMGLELSPNKWLGIFFNKPNY
jgi:hypothetical protein